MMGTRVVVAATVVLLSLPLFPDDGISGLRAQEPEAARAGALNVFLDCQTFGCDFDHFRRMIGFVDWVRDREDAQIHLLVTSEATGAGGRDYTLAFIGRGALEGQEAELSYVSNTTDTRDEVREGLARVIRMGLMPYVSGTPTAERIRIEYDASEEEAGETAAGPEDDPWDFWVFTVGARAFFNGESSFESRRLSPSLSARRITEDWKISVSSSGSWNNQTFKLSNGAEVKSFTRSVSLNWLAARSMGPHWTLGARGDVRTDTRLNQDLAYSVRPGIEYNFFPYSESTRRQLTLLYAAGLRHFRYDEITIFDQTEETRWDQSLTLSMDLTQPWGSASFSLEGAHYFHDLERNRVSAFGNLNFRLFRGLSLDVFGSYSRVRDELFVSARNLSDEEILLRQRALETDFRYFLSVGLRYTFGSIYNNIVNPRFDSSGGTVIFF